MNIFSLLVPYCQVSNFPNIFFNPIKILTDQFLILLMIIPQNNILAPTISSKRGTFSQPIMI